jgi:lipid-A-disaccharide synthase
MDRREDLLIFSNGPGEVSTWVRPLVEAVRGRPGLVDRYRIMLMIHPCAFGSGTEHWVGSRIEGVEHVVQTGEYMKMLLTGLGRKAYSFSREGIIFSLGGDMMHPVLFRRRIRGKHALYSYSHNPGWEKYYTRIFVRSQYVKDRYLKRGVPEDKLEIVGDLVYSSLKFLKGRHEVREEFGIAENERMVVFLPGSRDYMTKYMVPVFLKVIDDLGRRVEGIRSFLLKSPYISYDLIEEGLRLGGRIREADSITGSLEGEGERVVIRIAGGRSIPVLDGQLDNWGRGVDFAVSLPGTNTIQLAYRRIPTLVVVPTNKPEIVPLEGAIGMVKYIPLFGKMIVRAAVNAYAARYPFKALPNIYEQEEIFPELFGLLQTDDITNRVAEILEGDHLEGIARKLDCFELDTDPVQAIVRGVWGPAAI